MVARVNFEKVATMEGQARSAHLEPGRRFTAALRRPGYQPVPPSLIPAACEAITPQMLTLVQLTQEQIDQVVRTVPGGAANVQDIYPLAPLQEGILFHHMLHERGDTYILPTLLEFQSRQQLDAFTAAIQRVMDRHDVLRTAMAWQHLPRPLQVVLRHANLPVVELEAAANRDPVATLTEMMSPRRQRMDLQRAPLLRMQVSPDPDGRRWYGLLQVHHLVSDAISLDILISEVMAHLEGLEGRLPNPLQYRAHVAQSLVHIGPHDADAFFRAKLADIDEPTAPFDLLDVHGDGNETSESRHELDFELARRIRAQARRLRVSAATLFHAAWGLVVALTSARDDVVFGTVLFGRLQTGGGAQQKLGMFLNTLPLRLKLQGLTVGELVQQTQRELLELLAFEQASLAAAQRCSGVAPPAPLFTTLINYRHGGRNSQDEWANAEFGIRMLANRVWTNYPITLTVDDHGERFFLTAQTDAGFDSRRITAYMEAAVRALVGASEEDGETPALTLTILPESERQELIGSFNPSPVEWHDELLHGLFEDQVERAPQSIAVAFEAQVLTYAEVNGKANQLARHLQALGVGPDQLVAVCVERRLEMMVAVLGILKAGAAFVPLDPSYPAERLLYMLEDSAPRVLLTQGRLKDRLPRGPAQLIALDEDSSQISANDVGNVGRFDLHPGCLAYVIYTSGSTGTPKGVMVEHRGVCNLARAQLQTFDMRPDSRVLQFASMSFDAFVWEMAMAWCCGARLHLAPRERLLPGEPLLEVLRSQRITHVLLPPGAISALPDSTGLESLTTLIAGGEACPHGLAQQWGRERRLFNAYGPTEITVVASIHLCAPDEERAPPIGRPILNTRIYVLNAHLQPVPVGVAGEMYLGGAGVARGYLNRPELTAERFVADPFSTNPRTRMYKTGDVGRWRPDGVLEYLGRNDYQVKIRGFRIECGEIETQLARHAGVREVLVLAREDIPGEKRLVAYVVPGPVASGVTALGAEELRTHLRTVLPDHMVPSAFVVLDHFPVTPGGKVDRRALPLPELGAYVVRQYEAPQGAAEEVLASIWRSLLRVERVGRQDNFFELGGHSLLIVQLMERLRRVGLYLQGRSVFERPTLAALANMLSYERSVEGDIPPNLIPPGCRSIVPQMLPLVELSQEHIDQIVHEVPGGAQNIQDIYPLTPLQEGILFHHLLDAGADTYVLPTLLELSSRAQLDSWINALQRVVDRHEILRSAVMWELLPRPVQVVCCRAKVPVEELRLDPDRDPVAELEARMKSAQRRLNLARAPLLQLQIAPDTHSDRWYVLLQLHHLVCDGQSVAIVISEVIALLEGRGQTLPPPVPYRNHVAQALAYAQAHDGDAFFRRKLGDVDEPTAPFGLLDVRGDGSRTELAGQELQSAFALRIRAQARRLGMSAATLFHAVWGLVVARTSGRDDVVYGSVLLGRLRGSAGAQQILGMFINTLPLRLLLRDITAQELVEQTHRELFELLDHEHMSLAAAQRCSGISGSGPLFSSLLNYRHSDRSRSDWGSTAGVRVLASRAWTNYPFMLAVDDLGDGFILWAQSDERVAPRRLIGYVTTAMESLLEALEKEPQRPLRALSILPDGELYQVIRAFNETAACYPRHKLIHELFEEQVQRTPHATAVMHSERCMSYAEVNSGANRLARYLRHNGVGPDQIVAICVERGLDMVVGLLGILKAGGAYTPLDPAYPPERLAYMLEDARPQAVLTQERLRSTLPDKQSTVISLDVTLRGIAGYAEDNLSAAETGAGANNLVYVIYTSGSTGQPKGTAMPHRSMVNLIEWHREHLCCREEHRVLQFAALSFDVAFQEIFSTLCTGGTLVMLDEWIRRDPQALLEFLTDYSIYRLFLPPLVLQSLAESFAHSRTTPRALKEIITAGEQLRISQEIVNLVEALGSCSLHNHYGPTETHVVTALTLTGDPHQWPTLPTIGRPISNAQIYVLDERLQPVPIGVAGEVYIGGAGVAHGYLRRPELTERRFILDPFASEPGALLYRTGDLGKYLSDGTLEYLGRNDYQIKIRGYRIEPGEIEGAISRHERVKEAVVLAREDAPGQRQLVAYVTYRDANGPGREELRSHLKVLLPEYMVPSAFVILDRLPLTPNGKLDRRALPAPDLDSYARSQYEAPQGRTEEVLAEIWSGVLNVGRIGRDDDFFELGGHSLLGMRLIARIAQRLSIQPPVVTVFQYSTVRQMAQLVEGLMAHDMQSPWIEQAGLEEGVIE
jgi:amino acid adenylation domain-containing protein